MHVRSARSGSPPPSTVGLLGSIMEGGKKARGEEGAEEGELGPFNDPDLESRIMRIEDLQEELEKVSEVLILESGAVIAFFRTPPTSPK